MIIHSNDQGSLAMESGTLLTNRPQGAYRFSCMRAAEKSPKPWDVVIWRNLLQLVSEKGLACPVQSQIGLITCLEERGSSMPNFRIGNPLLLWLDR